MAFKAKAYSLRGLLSHRGPCYNPTMNSSATTEGDLQVDPDQYDRKVPTGWKFIIDLRMKDPSLSWKQIAKTVGYNYQTVLLWTARPDFQRYENWVISKQFSLLRTAEEEHNRKAVLERVRGKFESHMEEMQDRLLTILDTAEDPSLQAKIAQDWLDRSGAPAQRLDNSKRTFAMVMTPRMIEEFFERSKQAGLTLEGEIISQEGYSNPHALASQRHVDEVDSVVEARIARHQAEA